MRRGTTPTIKLKLTGIDLSLLDEVYVTFSQCDLVNLTKTGDDVTVDATNEVIKVTLTEDETLAFKAIPVSVQIRAVCKDESIIASSIKQISIGDVLYDEPLNKE